MPLTCECPDEFDYTYFIDFAEDYETLDTLRSRRCSCGKVIKMGDTCTEHRKWRNPLSDVEERIYGSDDAQVPLASKYLCEECSDLFFSMHELGFCVNGGENMKELLSEYHEFVTFTNEEAKAGAVQ